MLFVRSVPDKCEDCNGKLYEEIVQETEALYSILFCNACRKVYFKIPICDKCGAILTNEQEHVMTYNKIHLTFYRCPICKYRRGVIDLPEVHTDDSMFN